MLEVLDSIFLQPLMHLYSLVFAALPGGLGVGWRLVLFSVLINLVQRDTPPKWINLEYLSAEDYVERSHGLQSPVWSG